MPYLAQADPYASYQSSMLNFARRVVNVNPGATDLIKYPKALSIWVPSLVTAPSIVVVPSRNDDSETFQVDLQPGRTICDWVQVRQIRSISNAAIVVRALYDE